MNLLEKINDYLGEAIKPELLQKLKDNTDDDISGTNKQITFRREFFYSHGGSAEKFADETIKMLEKLGIKGTVVDKGEIRKPFNGGASTKNSTHWWVKVKIEKEL